MARGATGKSAGVVMLLFFSGLAGCTSGLDGLRLDGPVLTASQSNLGPASTHATGNPAEPGDTRPLLAITEPQSDAVELASLDLRLRQILTTSGYRIILPPDFVPPGMEIYFISPEITESEIAWIVADADGDPLGKIAQRRIVSSATGGNENLILLGAAAAAEGIGQIIRKQS